ncbi:hypothetical protein ABZ714_13000 [Streptomyces sp. NPDC006798]|uniref:hypothetical protein n=1 Tax=Streptomyces sp. NPDC006798 TaxID=3155462 RepID=UPI0033CAD5DF
MHEITADEWDKLYTASVKAGRAVARKFPGSVESDDITQGVMERFIQSEGAARKLLDSGDVHGNGVVFRALLIMANQVAAGEITRHRQFHGNFTYTTDHIRKLLAGGLLCREDDGTMFEAQLNALTTGRRSKSDFTVRITVDDKIDLERGMRQLTPAQRRILVRRYIDGDALDGAERKELFRAVEALTLRMNGHAAISRADHDGPGSRRAVSSAHARLASGIAYAG